MAPHPFLSTLVGSWADLDDVDLEEVFTQRVPMLRSCPGTVSGQLWADHEGDELAEERAR